MDSTREWRLVLTLVAIGAAIEISGRLYSAEALVVGAIAVVLSVALSAKGELASVHALLLFISVLASLHITPLIASDTGAASGEYDRAGTRLITSIVIFCATALAMDRLIAVAIVLVKRRYPSR